MQAEGHRTCWNCGYSVDVRARDCIICGKPVRARPLVSPARRRGLLFAAGALTFLGFLALYIYPNVRFAQEELAPRHRAPGIEFVRLRDAAEILREVPGEESVEPWSEWGLHGLRFQLPASGPLRFAGDGLRGTVLLPGWTIEYAFRDEDEPSRGGSLPVESEDALDDLRAFASSDWEFLADIYSARPDDFHIFFTAGARARLRLRLALKEAFALAGAESGIYTFRAGEIQGFLFGRPGLDRRIALQFPMDGGRLDLLVEEFDEAEGRTSVLRWLASLRDSRAWLAEPGVREAVAGRLEDLRILAGSDRVAIYGALFLLVGLTTSGSREDLPALEDARRAAEELREREAALETALGQAAVARISEARERGILDAAAGGEVDVDVLTGILVRARYGYRPELGPVAAQSLASIGSPRSIAGIASCLDATDPELARAAARALGHVSGLATPSPEAGISDWRVWWEAHRDAILGANR